MSVARYISPEERQALLVELRDPRDRLFFQIGVNTGLRISSILGLRWRQLMQGGEPVAILEVPRRFLKGGRGVHRKKVTSRRIPLNAAAAAAVKEWAFARFGSGPVDPEAPVFTSRKRYPGTLGRKQGGVCPDHKLYVVATTDAFALGILSTRIHLVWALNAGGTLEDRPTWTNTTCFLPFPFPDCTEKQKDKIRMLAEELDAHRKRAQQKHSLGLTDIYNVLEKVRAGEALTAKDKAIHDAALVSTLKQLHDNLDRTVTRGPSVGFGGSTHASLRQVRPICIYITQRQ